MGSLLGERVGVFCPASGESPPEKARFEQRPGEGAVSQDKTVWESEARGALWLVWLEQSPSWGAEQSVKLEMGYGWPVQLSLGLNHFPEHCLFF